MRYGDGGGLNQAARNRREQVRGQAAALFTQGHSAPQVAVALEVSRKTAYQWRRAWQAGGIEALASRGAPGPDPTLSTRQLDQLHHRLQQGPAAAGHTQDQRWTLARVAALIATMFGIRLSITTTWQVLHRLGYTPQIPLQRAAERDEAAIARWRRYQWPTVKGPRAGWVRGSCSPTSAVKR